MYACIYVGFCFRLTCYGTFVLLAVFWDKAWNVQKLDTAIYTDPETGKRGKLSTFQIFQVSMHGLDEYLYVRCKMFVCKIFV